MAHLVPSAELPYGRFGSVQAGGDTTTAPPLTCEESERDDLRREQRRQARRVAAACEGSDGAAQNWARLRWPPRLSFDASSLSAQLEVCPWIQTWSRSCPSGRSPRMGSLSSRACRWRAAAWYEFQFPHIFSYFCP